MTSDSTTIDQKEKSNGVLMWPTPYILAGGYDTSQHTKEEFYQGN